MKCWTRPNHLRTLVQPGTRPGLFWFLAWARSAVHVCTSISITKVWERAKNKRVRSWSLSKAMGKAALMEEQLGQLWWKGSVGWECKSCWAQHRLVLRGAAPLPVLRLSSMSGLWNGSESSACCSPWPLLSLFAGRQWRRQNEMLLESVWVCKTLYIYICIHLWFKKKHYFDMTSTNVSIMYLELLSMSLPDLQGE